MNRNIVRYWTDPLRFHPLHFLLVGGGICSLACLSQLRVPTPRIKAEYTLLNSQQVKALSSSSGSGGQPKKTNFNVPPRLLLPSQTTNTTKTSIPINQLLTQPFCYIETTDTMPCQPRVLDFTRLTDRAC